MDKKNFRFQYRKSDDKYKFTRFIITHTDDDKFYCEKVIPIPYVAFEDDFWDLDEFDPIVRRRSFQLAKKHKMLEDLTEELLDAG